MGRAGVNPAGPGSALGTHIVDVEVDLETGKVQILRYTSAFGDSPRSKQNGLN
jgi:CO/xanthine dehydrogenase Mo-binding subunit